MTKASCVSEKIGRTKAPARFAEPIRFYPVRIKAGALGEGVPSRDLPLSRHRRRAGAVRRAGQWRFAPARDHVVETFVYDGQPLSGEPCLQKI